MTDPTQAERERWEPDRALADLDCLALRERVRESEEAMKDAEPMLLNAIGACTDEEGHVALENRLWEILDGTLRPVLWKPILAARAALADHREGEDG